MVSWPPLSQKINYLLASQSIVWYLLCEITDIDTSNYHRYRHRYRYWYWYRSISKYYSILGCNNCYTQQYNESQITWLQFNGKTASQKCNPESATIILRIRYIINSKWNHTTMRILSKSSYIARFWPHFQTLYSYKNLQSEQAMSYNLEWAL